MCWVVKYPDGRLRCIEIAVREIQSVKIQVLVGPLCGRNHPHRRAPHGYRLGRANVRCPAVARGLGFYEQGIVQTLFWARLPGDTLIILGTVIYAADIVRKRSVLRATESDPSAEDIAVAEGVLDDD